MATFKRITRRQFEKIEDRSLAPYAARSSMSKGRKYPEDFHPYRTEFQRDRERIIHCKAFRRLEYKTQVFLNHEGDHYRTRLTHTIEVAQIARTIARALRLNEDLAESIALAHDLGHTPFGHAGEKALDILLNDCGGFEHNRQSLRVVEVLENNYSPFPGLNLTWETREGIIKHSSSYDRPDISDYNPDEMPSLEAQIIDYADEIAYNNHDLDDGLSSGLLHIEDVEKLSIWSMLKNKKRSISKDNNLASRERIREIINILSTDLIQNTYNNIEKYSIGLYVELKMCSSKIASFSRGIETANDELKDFLREKLYNHYMVARMTLKSQKVVQELFNTYSKHPETLPPNYQNMIKGDSLLRTVTDYIAGMTDRYAVEEYKKITDPAVKV
jgi:dGTPase